MPSELPTSRIGIDSTAGIITIKSTHPSELIESTYPNEPLMYPKQMRVRYIPFDRYEVGFVEDNNQRIIGICSIRVVKDFYDIEQLEQNKVFWDTEDDYE